MRGPRVVRCDAYRCKATILVGTPVQAAAAYAQGWRAMATSTVSWSYCPDHADHSQEATP